MNSPIEKNNVDIAVYRKGEFDPFLREEGASVTVTQAGVIMVRTSPSDESMRIISPSAYEYASFLPGA